MRGHTKLWFFVGFLLASLTTYFIGFRLVGIPVEEGLYTLNVYRSHPFLILLSCVVGLIGGFILISIMEFGIGKRGYTRKLTKEEFQSYSNFLQPSSTLLIICPYCDSDIRVPWKSLPDVDAMDLDARRYFIMNSGPITCTHCNTKIHVTRNSDEITVMMERVKRRTYSKSRKDKARFDFNIKGIISQIFYATGRSLMYSPIPALIVATLLFLFFIIYYGFSMTDTTLLVRCLANGFSGGFVGGLIFGLFITHDASIEDLEFLLRPDHRISIPAALFAFLTVFVYQTGDQDLTKNIFELVHRTKILEQLQDRRQEIIWGLVLSGFIGAATSPVRAFYPWALSLFTFGDTLRGQHPHHNEKEAEKLHDYEHGRLHAKAAHWYVLRGQSPRARYEWSEARRLGGFIEEDYLFWASFIAATGDQRGAEIVIREGLGTFKDSVKLLHGLTEIQERLGLRADQEVEFKHILTIDPDYAPALHDYGALLFDQAKYEEAIEPLTHAINLTKEDDPEIIRYLGTRGATYGQLGEYDNAEADFQRALRLATKIKTRTGKWPPGASHLSQNLGMLHGLRRR